MRAEQLLALAIAREHRVRLMMDIAQSVASIDEEMASALPQLGMGGGDGAYRGGARFGLARAAAALLPASEELDDYSQVESVTSFEGIGRADALEDASAESPQEYTESSERALVPYALMGQPAMHGQAGWARPGYSSFLVSELQRLLREGPMVETAAAAAAAAAVAAAAGSGKVAKREARRARAARQRAGAEAAALATAAVTSKPKPNPSPYFYPFP